jgi:hypothetical protein
MKSLRSNGRNVQNEREREDEFRFFVTDDWALVKEILIKQKEQRCVRRECA